AQGFSEDGVGGSLPASARTNPHQEGCSWRTVYDDDKRGSSLILGHESAGVVESVGPGVPDFKQVWRMPLLQESTNKLLPKNYSDIMAKPTTCFSCRGRPILQFLGNGTFSEYTVVNQNAVAKIDDNAPLDRVFLLGCCIPSVMGCKNARASWMFAVHVNEKKFEKAKVFGATDFLNPKALDKPISEVLVEMTNIGVDFSIECRGSPEAMRCALESCVKAWGVSVMVGYTDVQDFSARPAQLIYGKTWKGSVLGGFKSKESVPTQVRDYMSEK
ncbi:hypothetical protein DNTS_001484, partial [Danionella cerebrum]